MEFDDEKKVQEQESPAPCEPVTCAPPVARRFSFKGVIAAVEQCVCRFPVPSIYLFVFAFWVLFAIWHTGNLPQFVYSWVFVCGVGSLLTFAVSLWCERRATPRVALWAMVAVNLCLAADLVYFLIVGRLCTQAEGVGHSALITASVVGIFFAPGRRGGSQGDSWAFGFRQLGSAAMCVLVGISMSAVIGMIIFAIESLFKCNYNIIPKIYGSCTFLFAAVVPYMIFMGRTEAVTCCETGSGLPGLKVSRFYGNVVRFLFVPATVVYLAIVWVYGAKILINWELPDGEVCWTVTGTVIAVMVLEFMLVPLRRLRDERRWFERAALLLPALLLPLLVLMSVAIGRRFCDYGITASRLYVATFNLWAYVMCVMLLVRRGRDVNFVPLSFAAVFVVTSVLPGFNFTSISVDVVRGKIRQAFAESGVTKLPLSKAEFDAMAEGNPDVAREVSSDLIHLDGWSDDNPYTADLISFPSYELYSYTYYDGVVEEEPELKQYVLSDKYMALPDGFSRFDTFGERRRDYDEAEKVVLLDSISYSFPADSISSTRPCDFKPFVAPAVGYPDKALMVTGVTVYGDGHMVVAGCEIEK